MKSKLVLATIALLFLAPAVAGVQFTVEAEKTDGTALIADNICIDGDCESATSSLTRDVSTGYHDIKIEETGYKTVDTEYYVYTGETKTYQLEKKDSGHKFTVTAEDSSGNTLTADKICIDSSCAIGTSSHTETVSTGYHEVSVEKSGYTDIQDTEYVYTDEDKTYQLEEKTSPDGTLEVTVKDSAGDRISSSSVSLNLVPESKETDSNGEVSWTLDEAEYDIRAECRSKVANKYNVQVTGGETTSTTVRFDSDLDPNNCDKTSEKTDKHSFTVKAKNVHGDAVIADRICVDESCFYDRSSHTFSVETGYHDVKIEDALYQTLTETEYVFTDETKTYTLSEKDKNSLPEASDTNKPSVIIDHKPQSPTSEDEVTFTLTSSDENGIDRTKIFVEGTRRKTCFSSSCQVTLGPFSERGFVNYRGVAIDNNGNKAEDKGSFTVTSSTPRGSIVVRVSDSSGASLDASVKLEDLKTGDTFTGETGGDGKVSFDNLKAERYYKATASKSGYTSDSQTRYLSDGESESFSVEIQKKEKEDGNLRVKVRDSAGDRIENAEVTVDNGDTRSQKTDFSGKAFFSALEPGYYDITAICHGKTEREFSVKVRSGETATETLRFYSDLEPNNCDESSNQKPVLSLKEPVNGEETGKNPRLEWDANDPDSDTLENTVFIEEKDWSGDTPFDNPMIEENVGSGESFQIKQDLTRGQEYVWGVKTTDGKIAEPVKKKSTFRVRHEETKEPPKARFSVDDSTPETGQTVTFDASGSKDPDGSIVSYQWDMDNDGQYDDRTGQYVTWTFQTSGAKTVSLKVKDNNGAKDTRSKTLEVKTRDTEKPLVSIQHSPQTPTNKDQVKFTLTSSDQNGIQTTKIYVQGTLERTCYSPTCQVTLGPYSEGEFVNYRGIATDKNGNKAKDTGSFTVEKVISNRPPTITVTKPLDGSMTGLKPRYSWLIEDPDDSRMERVEIFVEERDWSGDSPFDNPDFRFSVSKAVGNTQLFRQEPALEEGQEYIWGMEADDGKTEVRSDIFSFSTEEQRQNQKPSASFSYTPISPKVGENVEFDATDSSDPDNDIVSYEWDFDDGDKASGSTVDHSFENPGAYDVTLKVTDSQGNSDIRTRTVNVKDTGPETGNLDVTVKDDGNDRIEDAKVEIRNSDSKEDFTDRDGEVNFNDLKPDTYDVTVTCEGKTEENKAEVKAGETKELTVKFNKEFEDDRCEREKASLSVNVEDESGNSVQNARVRVINGERETRFTDSGGIALFDLKIEGSSDSYLVTVSREGYRTTTRSVKLEEGEDRFLNVVLSRETTEKGIEITDVKAPSSVCRGDSLTASVTVKNRGDFKEVITLTGSGLGSITVGESFTLDRDQTQTRTFTFTNVQGSGTRSFSITATNHDSDAVSRTVNVRECPAQPDAGEAEDISLRLDPAEVTVHRPVRVSGYVDGVRGRKEVTIELNGKKVAQVNTQPDGYYETFIRPDAEDVGSATVTASTDSVRESRNLEVIPTATVLFADAPPRVFEGETFEVCGDIESQATPKVLLVRDGNIEASKNARGKVCFERTASGVGDHDYSIVALMRGQRSEASTSVEVMETKPETRSFPEKIASVESGSGMVKVTLYNTHHRQTRYDLSLTGIPDTWTSQSEKQVVLDPGEEREVFFYVTPEDEGTYQADLRVDSRGTTIMERKVNIWAGGTTDSKRSFLKRLVMRLPL